MTPRVESSPTRTARAGGHDLPPAGSILLAVSALFGVASVTFLSGPLPFDLIADGHRIAMGLIWAGVGLAVFGGSILVRVADQHLPPRGVAVLKARARFQKISRNQIRRKHQAFMRREFGELVAALAQTSTLSRRHA